MAAISKLIRYAPQDTLCDFLDAQERHLGEQLRSFGPEDDYAGPLLKAVDELSDEDHARLTVDADRVNQMVAEFGQTALLSVVENRLLVQELENAYARSLWVFLNEPDSFRRAEDIRYTDQHRQGRMWSAYRGPPNLTPDDTDTALEAFAREARGHLGSLDAHCEIYKRTRANFDAPATDLYQLTLYHDHLPATYLEFRDQRLMRRHYRPVVEASITYEPATGVIEVVTSGGKVRDKLARLFADTILGQDVATERMPLRRYDLSRLLNPCDFPCDPEDRIESVKVVLLRIQPADMEAERLTLETGVGHGFVGQL